MIEDGLIPRDAKDYKCEYCGKGEFTKHSLQRHIKSNHQRNERKYKFSLSKIDVFHSKIFNSIIYLGTRVFTHETKCPFCEAIFEKAHLKRHVLAVHEGIKRFKCNHCGKKYFEKKRLNGHIKKDHDKIRDEKCIQCGKLYFSKDVLNQHIKNIHKQFSCHICDQNFPTNANLGQHLNMKHLKEVQHDVAKDRVFKKRIRAGKHLFFRFLKRYYNLELFSCYYNFSVREKIHCEKCGTTVT